MSTLGDHVDDDSLLDRKGQLLVDRGDTVGTKYLLEGKVCAFFV